MIHIQCSEEIKRACPEFKGMALEAIVTNTPYSEELWQEIGALITERQLELLQLRALGLTTKEIAQMQNCSSNAIYCRYSRIKRKIQKAGLI